MTDYLGKLLTFFDRKTKLQLGWIFILMIFGAALDAFSISLVFPLLQLAVDPNAMARMPAIGAVIDHMGLRDPNQILLVFGIAILAFYVVKNVLLLAIIYIQNRFIFLRQVDFSRQLLGQYLNRPYAAHMEQNSAEILRNVMITTAQVYRSGVTGLMTMAMESMMVAGAMIVLLVVDPVSAVIATALVSSVMGIVYMFSRSRLVVWGGAVESRQARMIQKINEGLGSFKEIKLLGRERYFVDGYGYPAAEAATYRVYRSVISQVPRLVGEVTLIGAIFLVIAVSVFFRDQSVNDLVPVLGVFAAAALRVMPSANRIVLSANNIQSTVIPLDNLYRDYMACRDYPEPAPANEYLSFTREIALQNVTFQYGTAPGPSIRDVTLTIGKGESVAFVGATGAGKSTLADIVLAMIKPTAGHIYIDGVDVENIERSWQARIGYVPQDIALADDTLRRNIAFGIDDDEIDDARVWDVARIVQIHKLIESMPHGLDTFTGERGLNLSGGERQRIGIARALYNDPDVVVLDEATSSLDTVTEARFVEAVEGLRGDKTLIIIAHRINTIRFCDRIYFLKDGRVADSGSYDDLIARSHDFRRLAQQYQENEERPEP